MLHFELSSHVVQAFRRALQELAQCPVHQPE